MFEKVVLEMGSGTSMKTKKDKRQKLKHGFSPKQKSIKGRTLVRFCEAKAVGMSNQQPGRCPIRNGTEAYTRPRVEGAPANILCQAKSMQLGNLCHNPTARKGL